MLRRSFPCYFFPRFEPFPFLKRFLIFFIVLFLFLEVPIGAREIVQVKNFDRLSGILCGSLDGFFIIRTAHGVYRIHRSLIRRISFQGNDAVRFRIGFKGGRKLSVVPLIWRDMSLKYRIEGEEEEMETSWENIEIFWRGGGRCLSDPARGGL